MNPEFTATQRVYRGGYDWYDANYSSQMQIGDGGKNRPQVPEADRLINFSQSAEVEQDDEFREYDPFKTTPLLFLEFAELPMKEEASILAFTDRYGCIGRALFGASLLDYQIAIKDLNDAVGLWQAVQYPDDETLSSYVAWDKSGRLRWKSHLARPIKAGDRTVHFIDYMYKGRKYKKGDLLGPVTSLLDFVIETRPNWALQIKPHRDSGGLSLQIEVPDLLSVLWVQFAIAVTAKVEFERCQFCNRPLAVESGRSDRAFCSDNCRVKAYQRRRKQAIAMRQEGRALREIVRETKTDMETVKKWLTQEK